MLNINKENILVLKTEEEKVKDLSYKDELQGVTHRGKHRCE